MATLIVVGGVLIAPTVITCASSPEGMGACLSKRLSEIGILPPAAPAPEAGAPEQDEATTSASETSEGQVISDEAAPDQGADAETDGQSVEGEALIAGTFGLLRAEPDGSVVIAGSGEPGSEIEVLANGELLGRTMVEPSGDWVLVPDAPLPVGGSEITLSVEGQAQETAQSFVVMIDADKTAEPVVVASVPGKASEILQGLGAASASTSVAEIATAAGQSVSADSDTAASPESIEKIDLVAQAAEPLSGNEPVTMQTGTSAAEPEVEHSPDADQAAVEAVDDEGAEPVGQDALQNAGEEPASTAPPMIVTGEAAQPNPAADAVAEEVAEPHGVSVQAAPVQTASDDMPAENQLADDDLEATAVEMQQAQPAASVSTEAPQSTMSVPTQTAEPDTGETLEHIAALPDEAPANAPAATLLPPTIDAIEIDGDRSFFAGSSAESGARVRVYVDGVFVGESVVADGRWLVEAPNVLTKPSQMVRVDVLKPDSSAVAARAEVRFEVQLPAAPNTPTSSGEPLAVAQASEAVESRADMPAPSGETPAQKPDVIPDAQTALESQQAEADVPTLVGLQVGDAELLRFASGKAIIRRGDNLWTIARRVYGQGIKYTTIYQANTDQIRDPDRIYPGQVFDLPAHADDEAGR